MEYKYLNKHFVNTLNLPLLSPFHILHPSPPKFTYKQDHRVTKCDITKIIMCELMGFVEITQAIKTNIVSLPKINMLVHIASDILPQLYSNDSIQILLKMVLNVLYCSRVFLMQAETEKKITFHLQHLAPVLELY